ncbi:hypothetical protein [Aestuariivirga litoralis]|uniref:hypothetical protein n=1 Tax=Aestuariivirga litoralis TaxID=2650924 RepID=UPI0018C51DC0|nr:hypothetical protein [Aestuariivirga litoralis]MBG1230800.1 hypothetical protein [Aestuariivirga litoralis]
MFRFIDDFLNHTTMYRLVVYYVGVLLALDFGLGLGGLSPHDPAQLTFSLAIICISSWVTNKALAALLRIPANAESIWITALIIAVIMAPVGSQDWAGMAGLAGASAVGIASKFLLALNRKHIFNPVAVGVVFSAYVIDSPATWWVGGSVYLLPAVLLGGLLILRKLQRFGMFAAYMVAQLLVIAMTSDPSQYSMLLNETFLSSPLLFLGFAMLTEPLTAPTGKWPALAFGALVGVLSAPPLHIGDFYFSPELALMVGNVLAWATNSKHRYRLVLQRIERTAAGCYDYVFQSDRPLRHRPGQYIDWTMNVAKADSRGNRRTFTIASSPGERVVRLGVKFYPQPSAYKQAMLNMRPGQVVYGAQLAGEFVLPDTEEKLAFIAGGIGITPFRSMVGHMLEEQDKRDVTLFYGNNSADEISYSELFDAATDMLNFKTVYAVADSSASHGPFHRGFIDAALIAREMPDYMERVFYISGPRKMVLSFQKILAELGVSRSKIRTDFFPGFA